MNHISLCLIVQNEAPWLSRCLHAARPFVDETVVLDTGSTDETAALAVSLGATVASFPWRDHFAEARNRSLDLASGNWILILDADEIIQGPPDTLRRLACAGADAYTIAIFNHPTDPAAGPNVTTTTVRFFRNTPTLRYRGRIHEHLTLPPARIGCAPQELQIHHYGYTMEEMKRKDKSRRDLRLLQMAVAEEKDPETLAGQQFNLAQEFRHLGLPAEAATLYSAAAGGLLPHNPPAARMAAAHACECLMQLGRTGEALREIEVFLGRFPAYTEICFWQGNLLADQGRTAEAAQAYRRALQHPRRRPWLLSQAEPRFYAICWFNLGNIHAAAGQLRPATQCLARAALENPPLPEAVSRLRQVLGLFRPDDLREWMPTFCRNFPTLRPPVESEREPAN